jgi:hypothetical protein
MVVPNGKFSVVRGRHFPLLGRPIVILTDVEKTSKYAAEYFAFFEGEEGIIFGKRLRAEKRNSFFSQSFVKEQALEFAKAELRSRLDSIHSEEGDSSLLNSLELSESSKQVLRDLYLRGQNRDQLDKVRGVTESRPLIDYIAEMMEWPDLGYEDLFNGE